MTHTELESIREMSDAPTIALTLFLLLIVLILSALTPSKNY